MRANSAARPAEAFPSFRAEQALLGSLLIDDRAWALVSRLVSTEHFAHVNHRVIHDALTHVRTTANTSDVVLVLDHLERIGKLQDAGGPAYLRTLCHDTPTAANVLVYAHAVRDHAARLALRRTGERISRSATEASDGSSASDLVADSLQQLAALQAGARVGGGLVSGEQLAAEFLEDLDRRREKPMGLATGLTDLDTITNGLEPGDLIVVAGRPGMSKTAILIAVAVHTSIDGPVAIFSAEMPTQQLMRRAIAQIGEVSQGLLRRPERLAESGWSAVAAAAAEIAQRHLFVDDAPLPKLSHIRAECALLKAQRGLRLVLVDYLQLAQGAGANRYEQLRDVAYGLKALAKELAVPVIALAQLNRGVETRDNKRPYLSDLRDCGAIEEAADIVGLLYREDYYNHDFPMPNVIECAIEKNRNGERGECLWHFRGEFSRVTTLDEGARAQYRRHRAQATRNGGSANDL